MSVARRTPSRIAIKELRSTTTSYSCQEPCRCLSAMTRSPGYGAHAIQVRNRHRCRHLGESHRKTKPSDSVRSELHNWREFACPPTTHTMASQAPPVLNRL
jgi:hypothetical protein